VPARLGTNLAVNACRPKLFIPMKNKNAEPIISRGIFIESCPAQTPEMGSDEKTMKKLA
jgi:hypothetical protein